MWKVGDKFRGHFCLDSFALLFLVHVSLHSVDTPFYLLLLLSQNLVIIVNVSTNIPTDKVFSKKLSELAEKESRAVFLLLPFENSANRRSVAVYFGQVKLLLLLLLFILVVSLIK